jgi:ABC-type nickel/cobalt efflux system permease component RcnA
MTMIFAIEQPGLLEFNLPAHLNWGLGGLLVFLVGGIAVLMFCQDLAMAWRDWRAARKSPPHESSPAGQVSAEIEHSATRAHHGHHAHIREQSRFHVDNRVNKPTVRGFRER